MSPHDLPDVPDLLWTIWKFLSEVKVHSGEQKELHAAAVKAFNKLRNSFYPRPIQFKPGCGSMSKVPNIIPDIERRIRPNRKKSL